MSKRFSEKHGRTISNKSFMKKGGQLPCRRCGFYFEKYGKNTAKILGDEIICTDCFDSETD